MKVFVEDVKGYTDVYDNVYKVQIIRKDNKQYLEIQDGSFNTSEYILLKEIKLAYLIDTETMYEYFRYEK